MHRNHKKHKSMNDFFKGMALFVGGAIAGAATALLLSPKSGEELRKDIVDLAADAKKRTQEYYEQVKKEAQRVEAAAEAAAEAAKEAARAAMEEPKKAAKKAK